LLNTPRAEQRAVWFVLDELASLQRLPQLHTAITENRKSKNPLVLGFQGKAQLEVIYGHMAEVMLSQPATKIFLKTTEPKAAEWVSKAIGQVEIERMKETHYDGTRAGKNFSLDRQTEPLVMDSEISGLADKHAFLKLGNNVARFSFLYSNMPIIAEDFVPRAIEDDELSFDPQTLTPLRKKRSAAKARPDKAGSRSGAVKDLEAEIEAEVAVPDAAPVKPIIMSAAPVAGEVATPDVPPVAPDVQSETALRSEDMTPKFVPVGPIILPKLPVVGSRLL
jgi:hypothetical protein